MTKVLDLRPHPRREVCGLPLLPPQPGQPPFCDGKPSYIEQTYESGIVRVTCTCDKCGTTISWPEDR